LTYVGSSINLEVITWLTTVAGEGEIVKTGFAAYIADIRVSFSDL
jgi:hypothetical protein